MHSSAICQYRTASWPLSPKPERQAGAFGQQISPPGRGLDWPGRQQERLLVFGVRTISQDGGARGFLSAPSCCSQRTVQAASATISSLSAKLTRLCRV
jgi:hypothetical protein